MSPLVLFDIDGTLVTGGAATHVKAFGDALRTMTKASDPFHLEAGRFYCGNIAIGGLLDRQIGRLCLRHAGLDSAHIERFLPEYLATVTESYRTALEAGAHPGRPVTGVRATLDALGCLGMACGLVTGNVRKIAYLKLAHSGIGPRFPFGGFGDEGDTRAELFPNALAEARSIGLDSKEVCYLGDTPRDILAARQAGVPIVASATGQFSRAELLLAGAEMVIGSFEDAERVCDILADQARRGTPVRNHFDIHDSDPDG